MIRPLYVTLAAFLAAGSGDLAGASAESPAKDAHAEAPAPAAHSDTPAADGHGDGAEDTSTTPPPAFAAELAQMPGINGPAGWKGEVGAAAWRAIGNAPGERLQGARWSYALGLIAEARAAEAMGVLETMLGDDADLALVAQFQLARGATQVMLDRGDLALATLAMPELAANPEACLWRMRAMSELGDAGAALTAFRCALPAFNARHGADRIPFLLAASRASIDAGKIDQALKWLGMLPDRDGAANALRGAALLAKGDKAGARLRFERAAKAEDPEAAAAGRLGMIEATLAGGGLPPEKAIAELDGFRFGWRGGPLEAQALRIQLRLAEEAHDTRGQLRAGAALFRYFPLGAEAAPMMTRLQGVLTMLLAPESGVPLPEAAGLYWDYRELAPAGADGDRLVQRLADRLQGEGLYARAAELLGYQLTSRAQDVVQGPLSVKVAALHILAGEPERALSALQGSDQPGYPDAMRFDRKRVEAVALARMGRKEAALAALEGVPGGEAIRAEIEWRAKDWKGFVADTAARLPTGKGLSEPERARVLRHAIALAMLARNADLATLGKRYAKGFEGQPGQEVFTMLTGTADAIDPEKLAEAMAKIPSEQPPESIGDLLDAGA